MRFKNLSIILSLSMFPFVTLASGPVIEDLGFRGTHMYFDADRACVSELSYVSSDKKISYGIKDSVYRQSHNVQLWNLDFTTFNYILKLTDSGGNVILKEGSFTVVPADPTLIKKTEDTQKSLNEMTREELISLLDKLLKK